MLARGHEMVTLRREDNSSVLLTLAARRRQRERARQRYAHDERPCLEGYASPGIAQALRDRRRSRTPACLASSNFVTLSRRRSRPCRTGAAAPLERLGHPSDVADAVLFLASPAVRWISGAKLVVDGACSRTTRGNGRHGEVGRHGEPFAGHATIDSFRPAAVGGPASARTGTGRPFTNDTLM